MRAARPQGIRLHATRMAEISPPSSSGKGERLGFRNGLEGSSHVMRLAADRSQEGSATPSPVPPPPHAGGAKPKSKKEEESDSESEDEFFDEDGEGLDPQQV